MKNIYFNPLRIKSWSTIIIAVAFICIVVGFFELIPFDNPKNHLKVSALGYILTSIFCLKMFWFKNYVEWNKLGMNIKLNHWLSKSIRFDEVKDVVVADTNLTIIEKSGFKKIFQTDLINPDDVDKLVTILRENVQLDRTY
jgi:hypothetical protein